MKHIKFTLLAFSAVLCVSLYQQEKAIDTKTEAAKNAIDDRKAAVTNTPRRVSLALL